MSDVRPNFDSGDGALIVDLSCCLNKIALQRCLCNWLEHPGIPYLAKSRRLLPSHEHHRQSTRPAAVQPQPPETMPGRGGQDRKVQEFVKECKKQGPLAKIVHTPHSAAIVCSPSKEPTTRPVIRCRSFACTILRVVLFHQSFLLF